MNILQNGKQCPSKGIFKLVATYNCVCCFDEDGTALPDCRKGPRMFSHWVQELIFCRCIASMEAIDLYGIIATKDGRTGRGRADSQMATFSEVYGSC